MFAKIKNGAVVKYPIDNIRAELPNVSFPEVITDADIPDGYARVVYAPAPQYNPDTQSVKQAVPKIKDGVVEIGYDVITMSAEELQVRVNNETAVARQERDRLLAESDWTQVADAPVDKAAWAEYRQALRDITKQAGFPLNVTWPTPPAAA